MYMSVECINASLLHLQSTFPLEISMPKEYKGCYSCPKNHKLVYYHSQNFILHKNKLLRTDSGQRIPDSNYVIPGKFSIILHTFITLASSGIAVVSDLEINYNGEIRYTSQYNPHPINTKLYHVYEANKIASYSEVICAECHLYRCWKKSNNIIRYIDKRTIPQPLEYNEPCEHVVNFSAASYIIDHINLLIHDEVYTSLQAIEPEAVARANIPRIIQQKVLEKLCYCAKI
jgi:hypothetical protein